MSDHAPIVPAPSTPLRRTGWLRDFARAAGKTALDLVYPPSCLSCRAAVTEPGTLCSACWNATRFIERPYCERLGTPFAQDLGAGLLSPEAIADPRPARERGIDLMFSGNVGDPGPEAAWLERVGGGRPEIKAALAEALEAVRAENREPYAAIVGAYTRRGLPAAPLSVAKAVTELDGYAMMSRRFSVLRAIKGHRLTLLGEVSGTDALGHHDLRGTTSFAAARRLMAETKLLINSRSTFGRGGHERIFYGLSRGAVVATEPSSFLAEDLAGGLGMVQLPADPAGLDDFIADLLARPERLDELRARGLAQYGERHSWRERAGRIFAALEAHAQAAPNRP